MKILIHMNEATVEKQKMAIGNIHHAIADRGNEDHYELVTHGPGTSLVTGESGLSKDLLALLQLGVVVTACHNSLHALGKRDDEVLSGVTTVPSGISHLITRQGEGWLYIKA